MSKAIASKNAEQFFVEDDGDFRLVLNAEKEEIGRLQRGAILRVERYHPMEPGGDVAWSAVKVDHLTPCEVVAAVLGCAAYPVVES